MNNPITRKTAIMVDGGFYRIRALELWGRKSPEERAKELYDYCHRHIDEPCEPRNLYRIFYYDCPPLKKKMKHPLTGVMIDTTSLQGNVWAAGFQKALVNKRKVAMRMGELATEQAKYVLKPEVVNALVHKNRDVNSLVDDDYMIDSKQKGVDLRIGLDTASLAYGRYVDQIILIAGDSDFVPVAKMARRHGIDFLLDPLKNHVKPIFLEHIDGIESFAST